MQTVSIYCCYIKTLSAYILVSACCFLIACECSLFLLRKKTSSSSRPISRKRTWTWKVRLSLRIRLKTVQTKHACMRLFLCLWCVCWVHLASCILHLASGIWHPASMGALDRPDRTGSVARSVGRNRRVEVRLLGATQCGRSCLV